MGTFGLCLHHSAPDLGGAGFTLGNPRAQFDKPIINPIEPLGRGIESGDFPPLKFAAFQQNPEDLF